MHTVSKILRKGLRFMDENLKINGLTFLEGSYEKVKESLNGLMI